MCEKNLCLKQQLRTISMGSGYVLPINNKTNADIKILSPAKKHNNRA